MSKRWSTRPSASAQGSMTRETTLKTSQVFSHFQRRLNFMGNMQLPDIIPASRVSAMPIDREGAI